jgi:hypothetical protein
MSTDRMDPTFASALRDQLIRTVSHRRRFGPKKWQLGIGVLAGSTVIAGGVAVASGFLSSTPPGAPHDTPLSRIVTVTRTGTSTVELGSAPKGTTSISLTLTCLSVGQYGFPDGSSVSCSAQNLSHPPSPEQQTTVAVPLSLGQRSVTIMATSGASWTLRAVYVKRVITPWRTNANGQTYGQMNVYGTPDLIEAAVKKDGHQGYVKASDLNCASGRSAVQNPSQAAAWTEASKNRNVSVPVYESNGRTVIGSLKVGTPSAPNVSTVPVSSLYPECRASQPAPSPTEQMTSIRVPNIVGQLVNQAANNLAKLQLAVTISTSGASSTPTSRVISQTPQVGALVAPHTVIVLTLSGP